MGLFLSIQPDVWWVLAWGLREGPLNVLAVSSSASLWSEQDGEANQRVSFPQGVLFFSPHLVGQTRMRNFCRTQAWRSLSFSSSQPWVTNQICLVLAREIFVQFFISANETHSGQRKSHDATTAVSLKELLARAAKLFITLSFGRWPQGDKSQQKISKLDRHVSNLKLRICNRDCSKYSRSNGWTRFRSS